jgi:peptide subunit release factor RF-3
VAEIARKAGKEIFFKGLPYYNGEAFRGCDTSRILKNNVWSEGDVEKMVEHGRLEQYRSWGNTSLQLVGRLVGRLPCSVNFHGRGEGEETVEDHH